MRDGTDNKLACHEKVLRNFVKNHGRQKLATLVRMLEEQRSGQEIAEFMGVSRERIRQWKDIFGDTMKVYVVHDDVKVYLDRHKQ